VDDLVIREVKPADIDVIADIAVAAWTPIYARFREIMGEDLFGALYPDWKERKAGQVRRACQPDADGYVYVAEKEGKVVGFITFYVVYEKAKVAEIGNNAVHPDYQRQGIASSMYRFVFERMRELGMRFAKVGTGGDSSHAPARAAYEKVGFAIKLPGVTYYRKL